MSSTTCDAVEERLAALSIDGNAGSGVGASVSSASTGTDARMNDEDAANGKPLQMIQLPPEMVAIVLLHADFSEIPNVSLVSKEWNSAIKSGEDEHYLYLLRRHKTVLSKFSDKVLEADGGISPAAAPAATDTAVGLNANVGGDGNQIDANRGDDNTNDDDDRPKPSPKWKMIFRRALFIMKMAHNPRLRLNMLDGPNNRTTIPEPRAKSSYSFSTNIRVLTNDPNQGTDFNIAPDAVSGSDFDPDGCLPVEITRNHLCPIPTSKLTKGFMWISLRHSQSRNVPPVIFRGSYTSVDELKFKKRYKWKDMELPNGDLVVMGRRLCISTRNHVESHANGGRAKIRFRFDMESLPIGNDSAEKEMFQDLSQLEVLRIMESILFVNGPRVFIERAKSDAKHSTSVAASAASTSASLGRHSQGTTTINTTNSLLPPSSFANTEAAVARTAAAFEQISLDMAEHRKSLAMYRRRVPSAQERERRRRLYSSRRGRFQTTPGSSGPNFLGPDTAASGATSAVAAGPLAEPAVSPAADSQQEQIFRFGSGTASHFGASPSSTGDSPQQQQQPFRFGSEAAAPAPTGAAASSGDAPQQQQPFRFGFSQPFRFGSGSAAPSPSLQAEAARRFVESRRSRARSSTVINDSNTMDDGPNETEADDGDVGDHVAV